MTTTAALQFGATGMSILWLIIQHCFIGYRGYTLQVPESFEIRNGKIVEVKPSLSRMPQWRAQKKKIVFYFSSVHICLFYNDVSESELVRSYHERKWSAIRHIFGMNCIANTKTKSLEADRKKRKLLRLTAASKRRRRLASI